MKQTSIKINRARLEASILELGQFGVNQDGGLDRTTFTEAELQARQWLKQQLDQLSLDVYTDEAANIWARRAGKQQKSIVFGSHIDTVPNGGKYDGALGVLMALEVLRTLDENEIETNHPFELVSFSAEEPNPFGLSTFGSRAISGKLTKNDLDGVQDSNGTRLVDALARAGGDPQHFDDCLRNVNDFAAYLEVHIEQGKRLLHAGVPVGVVTAITGIYREHITVKGESNHAGTTVMIDRTDALVAAAELITSLKEICTRYPKEELVGTVGQLHVHPNATNIIPGEVSLSVEIRGETEADIQAVRKEFETKKGQLEQRSDVQIESETMLDQEPVPMSDHVITVIEREAKQAGRSSIRLGSMAGHDAAHMASLTPSGMIFVPSLDGKSHCPEEESSMDDIEHVANVFLRTLFSLDEGGGER
ncbi:M20 family metallo-hydrolase [Shouchella sp. JSM 1781072]|uniref:M20 family metallo-hydrolase n=1 Tax=Shouchella sp. JSM 1781072 TaxID=3344581 RepID=UPI0035C102C1